MAMTWQFKIFAFLAMLIVAGLAVWQYNSAIERAATLELQVSELRAGLQTSKHETELAEARVQLLNKLITEKHDYEADVQKQLATAFSRFGQLKRSDPQVQSWASTPIPQSVRQFLRANAAKTGSGDGDQKRLPAQIPAAPNPKADSH